MKQAELIVGRRYAFNVNDEGPYIGRLVSVNENWAVLVEPVAFGVDKYCVRHSSVIGPVESRLGQFMRKLWGSL